MADVFLMLDGYLNFKLIGKSVERAMEEASLMRKLLSYVRHLFRATMKSRDPTMNELKSIMRKKSGEVNKENTQINYIQYKL